MKHKNLLVLGASGACGRWVVQLGQERGHHITAVVRSVAKYEGPQGIQVIEGNVLDADSVGKAMREQDAVVSCLGIRRRTHNPWSAVVSPTDFTSQSARIIVQAMQGHDVRRVVAISSAGGEFVSRRVAKHVRMNGEVEASLLASSGNDLSNG